MFLAGVDLPDETVAALVARLREDHYPQVADKLDAALTNAVTEVGLTIRDRNAILDVLDDPPSDLRQVRAVLYAEYVWRAQNGLEQRPTVR